MYCNFPNPVFKIYLEKIEKYTPVFRKDLCFCSIIYGRTNRLVHVFFCQRKLLGTLSLLVYGSLVVYNNPQRFNNYSQKNIIAHKIWMIRSYAMAMTAVTFRVFHIIFYMLDWGHLENYELSLWISVLGNMLFAELVIYRQSKHYLKSFTT